MNVDSLQLIILLQVLAFVYFVTKMFWTYLYPEV